MALRTCGDLALALDAAHEGLAVAPPGSTVMGTLQTNVGVLHATNRSFERARDWYGRALKTFRSAPSNPDDLVNALINLAGAETDLGRRDRATPLFDEALEVLTSQDVSTSTRIGVLLTLGRSTDLQARDAQTARQHLQTVLRLAPVRSERRALALNALGLLARDSTRHRQALRILEDVAPESLGLLVVRNDLAMSLWLAHEHEEAIETVRGSLPIIESLRVRAGGPAERFRLFAVMAQAYEALIAWLLSQGSSDGQSEAFELAERLRSRSLIEGIRAPGVSGGAVEQAVASQRWDLADDLERADRRLAAEAGSDPGSVAVSVPPGTLLLSYHFSAFAGHAWSLDANGQLSDWSISTGSGRLLPLLDSFVKHCRTRSPASTAPIWQELSDLLLPPLPADVDRLVVVPSGPLHRLPYAALPLQGGDLLGDRVVISYLPSLQVPGALRQRRARRTDQPSLDYLGMADTLRLLHAGPEVETSAGAFARVQILQDRDATVGALNRFASDARVIHFAMHGDLDLANPAASGLNLSDRLLSVTEMELLELRAELVICSACDSGLGHDAPGEGPLTAARALMIAGADAVIVSLWRVDDEKTSSLMSDAVTQIAGGESAAAALRSASLRLRRSHPNPYFWAPFVLIGLDVGVGSAL